MNIIEWMYLNWFVLVALICVIAALACLIYKFIKLPTKKQIEKVKEWLKYAVTMAEKEYGSGTGQLKLRYVYNLFAQQFPWLEPGISFEMFSGWVDDALVWMREQLSSNTNIQGVVEGGEHLDQ